MDKINPNPYQQPQYRQAPQSDIFPPSKQKKLRKLKFILYIVLVAIATWSIYSKLAPSNQKTSQATTNIQAANVQGETLDTPQNEQIWQSAQIPLPSYPPVNPTTDLTEVLNSLEIPDFKPDIDSLRAQTDNL